MERAVISFKFVPCQTQTVTLFISVYRFSYIFIWFWLPGIILSFCFLFVLKHRVCLSNKFPQETVYCRHLHSSGYLSLLMVTRCVVCVEHEQWHHHISAPFTPALRVQVLTAVFSWTWCRHSDISAFTGGEKVTNGGKKYQVFFVASQLWHCWSFSLAPPTHKKWL